MSASIPLMNPWFVEKASIQLTFPDKLHSNTAPEIHYYLWGLLHLWWIVQPYLGWLVAAVMLRYIFRWMWVRNVFISHRPVPSDVEQLEQYFADSEAISNRESPIKSGAEKSIYWARGVNQKTKYAIVVLHGFSACRQELRPVVDEVAESLGYNVFFTRLSGHGGLDPATKMRDCRGEYLVQDAHEALKAGAALSEEGVILFGNSTGGALATFLLTTELGKKVIRKAVLSSPAFGFHIAAMNFFSKPYWFGDHWVRSLVLRLVLGNYDQWEGQTEKQNYWWSTIYPSFALIGVMEAVALANWSKLEEVKAPILCIASPVDKVIDHKSVRSSLSRAPDVQYWYPLRYECKTGHNILGANISPSSVKPAVARILDYLKPETYEKGIQRRVSF